MNYWTGDECKKFESEFAAYVGRCHAIALANGTVALELALVAYGVGPGDEVVVPARTFIASASCAVVRGATPIVAESIRSLRGCLRKHNQGGGLIEKTRAIVVVHLAGCLVIWIPSWSLPESVD